MQDAKNKEPMERIASTYKDGDKKFDRVVDFYYEFLVAIDQCGCTWRLQDAIVGRVTDIYTPKKKNPTTPTTPTSDITDTTHTTDSTDITDITTTKPEANSPPKDTPYYFYKMALRELHHPYSNCMCTYNIKMENFKDTVKTKDGRFLNNNKAEQCSTCKETNLKNSFAKFTNILVLAKEGKVCFQCLMHYYVDVVVQIDHSAQNSFSLL